jgi:hypothetical protein
MNSPRMAEADAPASTLLSGSIYATFAAAKASTSFEQAHGFRVTLWDLLQVYERITEEAHPVSAELGGLDEMLRLKSTAKGVTQ